MSRGNMFRSSSPAPSVDSLQVVNIYDDDDNDFHRPNATVSRDATPHTRSLGLLGSRFSRSRGSQQEQLYGGLQQQEEPHQMSHVYHSGEPSFVEPGDVTKEGPGFHTSSAGSTTWSEPPRHKRGFFDRLVSIWTYGWVAETLSCVTAVLSLLAIVGIVRSYENKPLPELPFGITINAMVAIFGAVLKASLCLPLTEGISQLKWLWFSQQSRSLADINEFDLASRGPWGSFLFLFRSGDESRSPSSGMWRNLRQLFVWQRSHLLNTFTKISAFLVILAFITDPFTQQIVQYVPCQRNSTSITGGVARTNTYLAQDGITGTSYYDIDGTMAAAINKGMSDPPADPASLVSFDCPTGNCTIPDFTTMAVCHSCQDITSSIKTVKPEDNDSAYGYSLGNGLMLNQARGILLKTGRTLDRNNLLGVNILIGPDISPTNDDENTEPVAFSCQLNPCLRTLRSGIVNSVVQEEEIARAPIGVNQVVYDALNAGLFEGTMMYQLATTKKQSSPSTDQYDSVIIPGTAPPHKGQGQGGGIDCRGSTKPAPGLVNVTVENIDSAPSIVPSENATTDMSFQWFPEACVWSMGEPSWSAINYNLEYSFESLEMFFHPAQGVQGDFISRRLWNKGRASFDSVDEFFRGLSDVMTATVRNRGGVGFDSRDEYARGPASQPMTCVGVGWRWISYPAALVGLATLWLAVLVVVSWRSKTTRASGGGSGGIRDWKSSSLALLLAGVAEEKASAIERRRGEETGSLFDLSRNELDEHAMSTNARLVRDEKGRAKFI